jgi:hypothetical protein
MNEATNTRIHKVGRLIKVSQEATSFANEWLAETGGIELDRHCVSLKSAS